MKTTHTSALGAFLGIAFVLILSLGIHPSTTATGQKAALTGSGPSNPVPPVDNLQGVPVQSSTDAQSLAGIASNPTYESSLLAVILGSFVIAALVSFVVGRITLRKAKAQF
jgi:hypothetical protein